MSEPDRLLRLSRLRAYKYRMPLERPYGTARALITESVNFVVHLEGACAGRTFEGFGESQPRHELTGDGSPDNVSAWTFLHAALTILDGAELDLSTRRSAVDAVRTLTDGLGRLAHEHAEEIHGTKPFRGTLLGIEVALLDLASRAMGLRLSQLLTERRSKVRISIATISTTADLSEVADRVARQRRFPLTRLKGVGSIEENLELLGEAAKGNTAAGRVKPLWIDINEAMDLETAAGFVRAAAGRMHAGALPAELIVEGPLPAADGVRHADLQAIADEELARLGSVGLTIQVMVDESLWDAGDLDELNARGGCRALNIKAPKAGGLLACLDLADAAIAADPDVHLCIGGMLGTSELTAWALHNLGRAMPRIDYMTTVPPRNVATTIAAPRSAYSARGSNLIARQHEPGLGTTLLFDKLAPYIEDTHDLTGTPPSDPGTVPPAGPLGLDEVEDVTGGQWVRPPEPGARATGGTFLAEQIVPGQVVVTMETGGWEESLRRRAKQALLSPQGVARRAHDAGAAALVTSAAVSHEDLPVLVVPDPRRALWALGAEARRRYPNPVVAVTGTAGKSSTTAMLQHVLSATHRVHYPNGNWNTIDGVSLTLAGLLGPSDIAVLEAAHVGFTGIEEWSTPEMIRPDIAIVTSIGQAHADLESSLEGTARLKARLFRGLGGSGTALLNLDVPHSDILLAEARSHAGRVVTYGTDPSAAIRLLSYDPGSCEIVAQVHGRRVELHLGVSGEHNAVNALAVLGVLDVLGYPAEDYLERFSELRPIKGRGQVKRVRLGGRRVTVVDQSYNANPASMRATLRDFGEQHSQSRRILVLGDMLELGEESEQLHTDLLEAVLAIRPARVFLVGQFMSGLWQGLPAAQRGALVPTPADLDVHLDDDLADGDVLFVKSSHSVGLQGLVARLQKEELPRRAKSTAPTTQEAPRPPTPVSAPPTRMERMLRAARDAMFRARRRVRAGSRRNGGVETACAHRNLGALELARSAVDQGAQVTWLSDRIAWASFDDRRIPITGHIGTESAVAARIVGDKNLAKELMTAAGVTVPPGRLVRSAAEAVRAQQQMGAPVVIKPRSGSMGHGVTVNVVEDVSIRQAFHRANSNKSGVLVERYIRGEEYRAHTTPTECVAIFRRLLPSVVGDGHHTINDLIYRKNAARTDNPATAPYPIVIDATTRKTLADSGLTLESVPATGEVVVVRNVNGITSGGDSEECFDSVSQSIKQLAVRAVASIPGMDWGGVDLLVEHGTGTAYVLELNTDASISGSTSPVRGTPRDVGAILLRRMYAKSKPELSANAPKSVPPTQGTETLSSQIANPTATVISLEDLLQEHLRANGWAIAQRNRRIWTASRETTTLWFSHALTLHDTAISTFPLRRRLVLRHILHRMRVPLPAGRRITDLTDLEAFRTKHDSALLLLPTRGPAFRRTIQVGRSQSLESITPVTATDWFGQVHPDGARLRIIATPERALAVIARSEGSGIDRSSITAATHVGVTAVRAIPQLRWAVVDVVLLRSMLGRYKPLVEDVSVQPLLAPGERVVAGSLRSLFDLLAAFTETEDAVNADV